MKNKIKELRAATSLTQEKFSQFYGIPKRTLENWEGGRRTPHEYIFNWLERLIKIDFPDQFTMYKVVDFIHRALEAYPEINPIDFGYCGKIFYRNSNDGTQFDWEENDRTCEFMSFYKSTDMGVFRVWVQEDGYITGFLYPDQGKGVPIELDPEFIGRDEAEDFKDFLFKKADLRQLWNKDIKEILK